ncbi:MAG: glycoside hydrolase family 3 C-terminal domain-containing protein, partial [Muribaculaceae bacterium]|nr:glycoside hydrolase family 3 C-terminal domain-containing protein [Muribaculaceae bacterium]
GRTVVLGPNAGRIPTGGGSGFVAPFSVTTVAAGMSELNNRCVALTDDILYRDVTGDIYTDSTCTESGFAGKYYKNMTREGEPAAVRTDSVIKFVWQRSAPFDGFPEDHFSAEWTAFYRPEFDTLLKIRVSGDDGYRVSINGKVIAADWGNHALSSREVEYSVEGGKGYDIHVEYFDNISDATMVCSIMALNEQLLARKLKRADNVVYCTGFNSDVEGEGFDRNFALPSYQERFMKRLNDLNPNLVVVVNAGGGVDFSAWDELARAILLAWYPGQEGGRAIAEILTGRLSPSGKLPISIENCLDDNPCAANYHKNAEPKERECAHVDYREGVFTGYRGYDRSGVKPRYPFGFGLGYSSFEFDNLAVSKTGENEVEVSFDIRNTGKVKAAEVTQIYVSDSESSVPRPAKELKGFEKVTLNPGESRRVTVTLDKEAFEYYDMNAGGFVVEPGKFVISVGNSSDNLPLKSTVIL